MKKFILPGLLLAVAFATAQPTISTFAPATGPVGTLVTISGTNFNAVPANNIVFFGAVKATVTAGTTTSLSVLVPSGATYQPISVLNISTGLTGYSNRPFIITFTNPFGSGVPANYYKPKVDFTAGNTPNSVTIGDLDGDGKPDLVISNSFTSTISVLQNTSATGSMSASSFAAKVDFTVSNGPLSVAIGDLDGDGKPDLVVANGNSTTISILRNTSTSGSISTTSFAASVDFTVGANPISVAIADMDGDGKPDVVVANQGTSNVSVLRNISAQGSITASSFSAKVDFTTGSYPSSVAIRDLDGDGKLDMVLANLLSPTLSILRNTSTTGSIGASSFAAKVDFTVGNGPFSVAIGDLDGDNKPDLVAANSSGVAPFTASVLRNTATSGTINVGSFAAKVDFTTGNSPRSAAIGDVDGDGKPDIVVANSASSSSSISVLRNTTTSGIIDASSFAGKMDFTTGTAPRSVAIGDLDGDGIPEVAVANGNANTVSIFQIDLSLLPLNLTGVKAFQQNKGVRIEWTAQQESNIDRYEIEKSQNGQQFYKVGSVLAKGNSNVVLHYNFFDAAPFTGISFYRIKTVETGQSTYSQILKVNTTNNAENKLVVYPNPIQSNAISLQINLPTGAYKITLTNLHGQQIINKTIAHSGGAATETLRLSNALVAGVYQIRLIGENINITRQVIRK